MAALCLQALAVCLVSYRPRDRSSLRYWKMNSPERLWLPSLEAPCDTLAVAKALDSAPEGIGATGGRVVEPRRADYAYDCRRGARGPTLTEG